MTGLLAQLTPLFCKKLKIAMMTFDHEYFVEFCFDEFSNTDEGRVGASIAISSPSHTSVRGKALGLDGHTLLVQLSVPVSTCSLPHVA